MLRDKENRFTVCLTEDDKNRLEAAKEKAGLRSYAETFRLVLKKYSEAQA